MSVSKIVLTTVLTTLTALVFVVVAAASLWPFTADAHGGLRGHWGGHSGNHQTGTDRHQRALEHCQSMGPAHTRIVEAAISAGLNLDVSQEEALSPVISVLDDWRQSTANTCAELAAGTQDIDQKMAAMEQVLRISADSVAQLRPAYASFSTQLSPEQQARIQTLMQRHHGE